LKESDFKKQNYTPGKGSEKCQKSVTYSLNGPQKLGKPFREKKFKCAYNGEETITTTMWLRIIFWRLKFAKNFKATILKTVNLKS